MTTADSIVAAVDAQRTKTRNLLIAAYAGGELSRRGVIVPIPVRGGNAAVDWVNALTAIMGKAEAALDFLRDARVPLDQPDFLLGYVLASLGNAGAQPLVGWGQRRRYPRLPATAWAADVDALGRYMAEACGETEHGLEVLWVEAKPVTSQHDGSLPSPYFAKFRIHSPEKRS